MPRPLDETPRRSPNCAENKHRHCTGCTGCDCHHVPAPSNFRELINAMKEKK